MPELPEVETTCRGIAPHAEGQMISDVIVRNKNLRWPVPARLKHTLSGQAVEHIGRRGKYLLIHTVNGCLILHLGMSGSLCVIAAEAPARKHDHVDIVFANGLCLRLHDPRRFGSIHWTTDDPGEHKLLKQLGPEPLDKAFNTEHLWQASRRRQVAIKNFIMNSHIVVGVGNIYASEALFLAGIRPTTKAGKISRERYTALVKAIKAVIRSAIRQGGTTLRDFTGGDGKPGYFKQKLNVYGRQGEACKQCNSPIKNIVIGQRASYYCPQCQK